MRPLRWLTIALLLAGCTTIDQPPPTFRSPLTLPSHPIYLPMLAWDGRLGKGVAMTHSREAATDACADAVRVGATWGYDWSATPPQCDQVVTLPMIWSVPEGCPEIGPGPYVLTFNEPDRPDQANLTPEAAAAAFQRLSECYPNRQLTTPAVILADDNTSGLTWLDDWWHASPEPPRTLDLAIHCYSWHSAASCIANLTQAIQWAEAHGLTHVLVTEFAVLPCSIGATQAVAENRQLVAWLQAQPQIIGYAFFATRLTGNEAWGFKPHGACTTALFHGTTDQLSPFGTAYAGAP